MNENLLVDAAAGTPTLRLETGTVDRNAIFVSVSGKVLSFAYTVQAGDTSADLDYGGRAALQLNGGTIKDAAGNNAVFGLAAPGAAGSLGRSAAIVIETVAPTFQSASVTGNQMVLSYLEAGALDAVSLPFAGAFEIGRAHV